MVTEAFAPTTFAVSPKLVDSHDGGGKHIRRSLREFLSGFGAEAERRQTISADTEDKDRQEEQRMALGFEQRLPCLGPQRDGEPEALRPVARYHSAVRRLPQDRLEG